MAATAAVDPAKYAEELRKSLMQDLFEGEDLDAAPADGSDADAGSEGGAEAAVSFEDFASSHGIPLPELDREIEELQENEIIRAILDQGHRLKEYSRGVDDQLRTAELASIQDYIAEADNMVSLHEQIKSCDAILAQMEKVIGGFQSDLGRTSEEIRALQVQSASMSQRLRNRRAVEAKLGAFVDNIIVTEELVTSILDGEVNEDYLSHLLALDRKLAFVQSDETARSAFAARDLLPAIEKLRIKALTKVREFVLQRIYQLKRPKTNIQIIQQSSLLKYKYFVRFLRAHGKEAYAEIRAEYIATLSKILAAHFRTYLASMREMQTALVTAADVIGVQDASALAMQNVMSMFAATRAPHTRPTSEAMFALGERAAILADVDSPAMIPHVADLQGRKLPYEVIFRHVHKLLLDTATSEYLFTVDFFGDESVFKELYAPIIKLVEEDLNASLQEVQDVVAVLLMVQVNHGHRRVMLRRRVPCLDDYLDRVHLALWPRLKLLLDGQLGSIRSGTERQLFGGAVEVHSMTRRYAALAASIYSLMSDAGAAEDEGGAFRMSAAAPMMERMNRAVFDALLRLSNMFKDKNDGITFLVLNFVHVLRTLRAADEAPAPSTGAASAAAAAGVPGAAAAEAAAHPPSAAGAASSGRLGSLGTAAIAMFEEQIGACTALYVDEQLQQHVGLLLDFVKKAEQAQKRGNVEEGATIPGFGPADAAPIVSDFAIKWQPALAAIQKDVVRQFGPHQCDREVLQASLTQLVVYYSRMLALLQRQGAEGAAVARDAVGVPAIMYEIRKMTGR